MKKENINDTIHHFNSLYGWFLAFYVNDYYHAQNDALEILNHKMWKKVNSNLITLTPEKEK